MNMTSLTPSTGERRPVAFDLNRLKLKPGELVVYWSHTAQQPRIDTIDGYDGDDGNVFVIAGERVVVVAIWARIPDGFDDAQRAAIIGDIAAIGRPNLTFAERTAITAKYGLE